MRSEIGLNLTAVISMCRHSMQPEKYENFSRGFPRDRLRFSRYVLSVGALRHLLPNGMQSTAAKSSTAVCIAAKQRNVPAGKCRFTQVHNLKRNR